VRWDNTIYDLSVGMVTRFTETNRWLHETGSGIERYWFLFHLGWTDHLWLKIEYLWHGESGWKSNTCGMEKKH
jgi:hypothetical protein